MRLEVQVESATPGGAGGPRDGIGAGRRRSLVYTQV